MGSNAGESVHSGQSRQRGRRRGQRSGDDPKRALHAVDDAGGGREVEDDHGDDLRRHFVDGGGIRKEKRFPVRRQRRRVRQSRQGHGSVGRVFVISFSLCDFFFSISVYCLVSFFFFRFFLFVYFFFFRYFLFCFVLFFIFCMRARFLEDLNASTNAHYFLLSSFLSLN